MSSTSSDHVGYQGEELCALSAPTAQHRSPLYTSSIHTLVPTLSSAMPNALFEIGKSLQTTTAEQSHAGCVNRWMPALHQRGTSTAAYGVSVVSCIGNAEEP
jgi:hypothetical protein